MRFLTPALLIILSASLRADDINYNRDIRPILSDKCFYCHGPDSKHREADLRLDVEEAAHDSAIVAGDPDDSELIARITSDDEDLRMPPAESGKTLSNEDIELLRRWIEQGAKYQGHWSFTQPTRPALPEVKQADWIRNAIDHFVLARLEVGGLKPSRAADKATLIRRVSLDLTGLPPTPEEVDAFLSDLSPQAYEKVVDRLLKSDRYGESMALVWLDAARYADTNGYQSDRERKMWIWRDWVINAYNANMPFDQFTIEQIAGDMLPNATIDQKIASGFNRNHRINSEGGVIPEEYRVEYVIDRVSTTGTVWLGLTLGCARCHSHKFDPISQKEFYQLFSYFNNVPENGRDGNQGNAVPMITVPIPEMQPKVEAARQEVTKLKEQLNTDTDALRTEHEAWEKRQIAELDRQQEPSMWSLVTVDEAKANNNVTLQRLEDHSYLATGPTPANATYTITLKPGKCSITGVRLEALRHANMTQGGLSRSVNGNFVLTEFEVLRHTPDMNEPQRVKIASAIADHSQDRHPIANAIDGKPSTGWAILGRPKPEDRIAVFTFQQPLESTVETTLIVRLKHDSQFAAHAIGRFRLSATSASKPALEGNGGLPSEIVAALKTPKNKRSDAQQQRLAKYHREISATLKPLRTQLAAAKKRLDDITKRSTTTVMVMQEMETPRQAFFLNRGQYDQPGEEVQPGLPASLGALPDGVPNNRLGFAHWLVDPNNPLTARVAVNRYWQMYFGAGLVRTASDFGAQGEWPSHPELLDWLAVEFIESGWNVKAIQKIIVMSATYRQSSQVTSELKRRDPDNRLLARGPRFRLNGFAIRDQALAVSGLLVEKLGGPSVYPYQPAGMWSDVAGRASGMAYKQSTGDDLYRRSMYTFWKRTVAPPTMIIFDASGREACNVSRNATNTPLQSLATLNDVQFVEAARFLAERMMLEGGETAAERLTYGWRLALVRRPHDIELKRLVAGYEHHLSRFRKDPKSAEALLSTGDKPRNSTPDATEHAALTAMANVILNLDETVTKE